MVFRFPECIKNPWEGPLMFKNILCSFFLLFPSLCMGRHVWEGALTCACAQRPQFHSGYFSCCFHSIWSSVFQWAWWASNLWDLLFVLRALELQGVLLFLVIIMSVRDLHSVLTPAQWAHLYPLIPLHGSFLHFLLRKIPVNEYTLLSWARWFLQILYHVSQTLWRWYVFSFAR